MPNVTVQTRPTTGQAKARVARGSHFKRQLVGRSLEPLVGPEFLHFWAVYAPVGAENRKLGLKIAFSGS